MRCIACKQNVTQSVLIVNNSPVYYSVYKNSFYMDILQLFISCNFALSTFNFHISKELQNILMFPFLDYVKFLANNRA